MAEFKSQRAIALMAGHGAIAFKCADLMFPDLTGKPIPNVLAVTGGLVGACWGAWCAFHSLQHAGDTTGDKKRYLELERDSLMILAALVIGAVGAVAWPSLLSLFEQGMTLFTAR